MMLTIIKILNQIGGVGVILTVGGSFIKYNSKKGWKCRKNASNREKFFFLFLKMLLATIIATIVFVCIRYIDTELLKEFISKSTFDGISKIFLLVFDILVCIAILQNEWKNKEERIAIKNFSGKHYILLIVYIFPALLACTLFSRYIVSSKLIDLLCLIGTVGFFVIAIFFLDGKKEYGYKYATIYTGDENEIQNLDVNSIQKKGKWFIGIKADEKIEYRIRIQDIRRVEYMNEKNRN